MYVYTKQIIQNVRKVEHFVATVWYGAKPVIFHCNVSKVFKHFYIFILFTLFFIDHVGVAVVAAFFPVVSPYFLFM